MKIAKNLKQHREMNNLTQVELSKLTGITQGAISHWETEKRIPNVIECAILADFYGITIDELVGHEIKKNW